MQLFILQKNCFFCISIHSQRYNRIGKIQFADRDIISLDQRLNKSSSAYKVLFNPRDMIYFREYLLPHDHSYSTFIFMQLETIETYLQNISLPKSVCMFCNSPFQHGTDVGHHCASRYKHWLSPIPKSIVNERTQYWAVLLLSKDWVLFVDHQRILFVYPLVDRDIERRLVCRRYSLENSSHQYQSMSSRNDQCVVVVVFDKIK